MTTPHGALSAAPPALDVQGLTVTYGGFLALSDASLRVDRESIVALIGPNGAGKTTCFNAIGGFVRPKRGSVSVDGKAVKLGDPASLWEAGVGRTFQRLELFWTLSVREHLELAHQQARRRDLQLPSVDDVIDLVGLEQVDTVVAAALPLGTCRLVELARALCTGAQILMLDEPSSGLDREETAGFEATVRRVHREHGMAILLVEHDMELVTSLADHVYVLDFGQMIADGTPREIHQSPIVQRVYLGANADEEDDAAGGGRGRAGRAKSAPAISKVPLGDHFLDIERLRVAYDGQVAVHDVSLQVGAGECVAILGANGAGKSSVLGAISGLVRPVTGSIQLDGQRIDHLPGDVLNTRGILHIPEGRGVFPSLTVADNLRVMLGPEPDARERVLDQFPRLGERLHQPAGTMSGGEQQMLALAPALAGGYRFLLVDELSLGLAPLVVEMLFQQLEVIRATGVGMVIVEQFAQRALDLATWTYVLRKGRVVFEGPADELRSRPDSLRDLYFGSAA